MPNPVSLTSTVDGTLNLNDADAVPVFLCFGDSTISGSLGGHVAKGEQVHDANLRHDSFHPYAKIFNGSGYTALPSQYFKYWDQSLSVAKTVEWGSGTTYAADDTVWVTSDAVQNYYRCIAGHSNKEPGTAADWETYWTKTNKWMSDERLASVYGARGTGRYYSNNGAAVAADRDKFAPNLVRPRTAHTATGPEPDNAGWDAASFVSMHPYVGFSANKFFPLDKDEPDTQHDLRDNSFLWTFGQWMLFNPESTSSPNLIVGGLWRKGAGRFDFTTPHYVHFGVSGAAAHQLSGFAPSPNPVRRTSFSPDYSAPTTADQVSAYQQFNDMYLKPAIDALQAAGKKPYIAGMIVALGSKDCSKLYNTTQADKCAGSNGAPAKNVGTELVKITNALKTALGVANVPTIYLDILQTESPLAGTDSRDYGQVGRKSLADAIAGDPYSAVKVIQPKRAVGQIRLGSDNVHMSATAMDKLGYEVGDMYYSTFVDKGLQIEECTATLSNLT